MDSSNNSSMQLHIGKGIFTSVLYPGKVIDDRKALECIGGEEAVSSLRLPKTNATAVSSNSREKMQKYVQPINSVKDEQLHCKIDPDNPDSSFLYSETKPTTRFLLKVSRQDGGRTHVECLGRVTSSTYFPGFADFSTSSLTNDHISIFPSKVSTIDTAYPYSFKHGNWKALKTMQDSKTNSRSQTYQSPEYIEFASPASRVPTNPRVDTFSSSEFAVEHPCTKKLQELFQQKPCWSQIQLVSHIADYNSQDILRFLPSVAYRFVNGPWRNVWIRFGYDPRSSPDSRIYQVFDFRLEPEEAEKLGIKISDEPNLDIPHRLHKQYRKNRANSTREQGKSSNPSQSSSMEISRQVSSFERPPVKMVTLYQLCDLRALNDLKNIIDNSTISSECSKASGWYERSSVDELRDLMKTRVKLWISNGSTSIQEEQDEESELEDEIDSQLPQLERASSMSKAISLPDFFAFPPDDDIEEFQIYDE